MFDNLLRQLHTLYLRFKYPCQCWCYTWWWL